MIGKRRQCTPEQKARREFVKLYMSCLPCLLKRHLNVHCDYHHVVEGQKRLGEDYAYGSCLWHHKGIPLGELTRQDMIGMVGVSYALSRREFRANFGNERTLVALVDYAHEIWKRAPWLEFGMPHEVRRLIFMKWLDWIDA